jgi:hypothetical protein
MLQISLLVLIILSSLQVFTQNYEFLRNNDFFYTNGINGGFRYCIINSYDYKFGEVDRASKIQELTLHIDSTGNVTKINYDQYKYMSVFRYNSYNKLKEEVDYDCNGNIIYKHFFEVDNDGKLLSEICLSSPFREEYSTSYKYNNGLLIESYKSEPSYSPYMHFWDEPCDSTFGLAPPAEAPAPAPADYSTKPAPFPEEQYSSNYLYQFSENRAIIEVTEYYQNGYESKIIKYYFNGMKKIVKIVREGGILSYIHEIITFNYNEHGNISEAIFYNLPLEEPFKKKEFIYFK